MKFKIAGIVFNKLKNLKDLLLLQKFYGKTEGYY